jgi:hypothetical protein
MWVLAYREARSHSSEGEAVGYVHSILGDLYSHPIWGAENPCP